MENAREAGEYVALAHLRSRLTGVEYASDTISFQRLADASASIQGFVDVARPSLLVGEMQTCLFTVRNRGSVPQLGATLRKRVVALDSGDVGFEQTFNADLIPGADYVASDSINTIGYAPGDHACLIEMDTGNSQWRLLDSEPFTLLAPAGAGILVSPVGGLVTSEAGQSASFNVSLASQPSADVIVPMQVSDASEWSIAGNQILFTPTTWNVPRVISVNGVDDSEVDGDQAGHIELLAAQSADPGYAGLTLSMWGSRIWMTTRP